MLKKRNVIIPIKIIFTPKDVAIVGGIGLAFAGAEALAIFGARKYQVPTTGTEKMIKYSLLAIAAIAAIGATFSGTIAVVIACSLTGISDSCIYATFYGAILLSGLAHYKAFKGL